MSDFDIIDVALNDLNDEFPDSGIKTVDDLVAHPEFKTMLEHTQKGYELPDAYAKISRRQERIQKEAISDDEWKFARALNPKMTKEEYRDFKKSQK